MGAFLFDVCLVLALDNHALAEFVARYKMHRQSWFICHHVDKPCICPPPTAAVRFTTIRRRIRHNWFGGGSIVVQTVLMLGVHHPEKQSNFLAQYDSRC